MKFTITEDKSAGAFEFTNEELEVIKNNDNKLIFESKNFHIISNGLLSIVANLSEITKKEDIKEIKANQRYTLSTFLRNKVWYNPLVPLTNVQIRPGFNKQVTAYWSRGTMDRWRFC